MNKHLIWQSDAYLEDAFLEDIKQFIIDEEGEDDPSDEQVME